MTPLEHLTTAELNRICDYRGQWDTCADDFQRTAERQRAARAELARRAS